MSDSQPPWHDPQPPDPHRRDGCVTVLIVSLGVMMLLPGLCAVLTASLVFEPAPGGRLDPDSVAIWLLGAAIGAAGIAVIVREIRRTGR